ncbi:hypothetical protein L6R29_09080 [Myxococcota bacterium]|nr:hypothetical protein [Myxococcota bacterium]
MDPVFGGVSGGVSHPQHCRLKCREHGFFWQLRKSYLITAQSSPTLITAQISDQKIATYPRPFEHYAIC